MRICWKLSLFVLALGCLSQPAVAQIGVEVAVPQHLQDGDEFVISTWALIAHGNKLFTANWTGQEGGGRPLTKGTGAPLADPSRSAHLSTQS